MTIWEDELVSMPLTGGVRSVRAPVCRMVAMRLRRRHMSISRNAMFLQAAHDTLKAAAVAGQLTCSSLTRVPTRSLSEHDMGSPTALSVTLSRGFTEASRCSTVRSTGPLTCGSTAALVGSRHGDVYRGVSTTDCYKTTTLAQNQASTSSYSHVETFDGDKKTANSWWLRVECAISFKPSWNDAQKIRWVFLFLTGYACMWFTALQNAGTIDFATTTWAQFTTLFQNEFSPINQYTSIRTRIDCISFQNSVRRLVEAGNQQTSNTSSGSVWDRTSASYHQLHGTSAPTQPASSGPTPMDLGASGHGFNHQARGPNRDNRRDSGFSHHEFGPAFNERKEPRCYNPECNEYGHYRRDCPKLKRNNVRN